MRTPSNVKRRSTVSTAGTAASLFALLAATTTTLTPSVARAQSETNVSPNGRGIVGGALLGAEVGTIVESIAGVHSPWVYVITDLVLGAGGAVGGWAVEQQVENHGWDVRVPVFMLAGGLGLIIPAVVLTLNGTRYQPSENASEDHAPTNAPAANPGTPGGSIVGGGSPASAPPPPPPPPSSAGDGNQPHSSLFNVGRREGVVASPRPFPGARGSPLRSSPRLSRACDSTVSTQQTRGCGCRLVKVLVLTRAARARVACLEVERHERAEVGASARECERVLEERRRRRSA